MACAPSKTYYVRGWWASCLPGNSLQRQLSDRQAKGKLWWGGPNVKADRRRCWTLVTLLLAWLVLRSPASEQSAWAACGSQGGGARTEICLHGLKTRTPETVFPERLFVCWKNATHSPASGKHSYGCETLQVQTTHPDWNLPLLALKRGHWMDSGR